jgi:uncharacterized membrane protein YciS (DUF1049 family)
MVHEYLYSIAVPVCMITGLVVAFLLWGLFHTGIKRRIRITTYLLRRWYIRVVDMAFYALLDTIVGRGSRVDHD